MAEGSCALVLVTNDVMSTQKKKKKRKKELDLPLSPFFLQRCNPTKWATNKRQTYPCSLLGGIDPVAGAKRKLAS